MLCMIIPLDGGAGLTPGYPLPSPPVYPGHGLPQPPMPGWGGGWGSGARPDQGLPWGPGRPDNSLPWGPGHPSTGFPPVYPTWGLPNVPGRPDNTLPPEASNKPGSDAARPTHPIAEGGGWVLVHSPIYGTVWVPISAIGGGGATKPVEPSEPEVTPQ